MITDFECRVWGVLERPSGTVDQFTGPLLDERVSGVWVFRQIVILSSGSFFYYGSMTRQGRNPVA